MDYFTLQPHRSGCECVEGEDGAELHCPTPQGAGQQLQESNHPLTELATVDICTYQPIWPQAIVVWTNASILS